MRTVCLKQLLLVLALSAGLCDLARANLSVSESTVLDFGTVVDGSGMVRLGLSDSITSDSSGIHLGGSVQSGVYVITGTANCSVKVTLTGSTASGLQIDSLTGSGNLNKWPLGGSGSATLTVGANLTVDDTAASPGADQALVFTFGVVYKNPCSGTPANSNFNGRVDVYAALGVSETTELDFGLVALENGTITLGLSDSITSDTNGISYGGTIASGVYTVTGEASTTVSISLAGSSSSGLTIGTFTSSEADLGTVSLGAGGSNAVTLGADLTVAQGPASTGDDQALNFTITVNYN
ncbi:MAG: DUF4402 domain-containing protein [Myxococcales bacterium]|nr:DUF4402 domain-containing protein [Myxococcales bacterium]